MEVKKNRECLGRSSGCKKLVMGLRGNRLCEPCKRRNEYTVHAHDEGRESEKLHLAARTRDAQFWSPKL